MGICDENIFEKVYQTWCVPVQRFLISRGLNSEDSKDITQESFLKLWNKCKDIDLDQAKSFLFTTANRMFIDQFRKKQSRLKYRLHLKTNHENIDGQFLTEMTEFKTHLEHCIESMNESSREVFLMHRFNDMKYAEIAHHLNISVKAVEKRMHKALLHLKDKNIPKI